MPKLRPDTQQARRENILNAAELCFARSGFHRCTMQEICKEAGISSGALYVYFKSKEDLIAGLCERDRAMLSNDLGKLADANDLLGALQQLGQYYLIDWPRHKQILHVEIGAEATRNPNIEALFSDVDQFCRDSFEQVFARAKAEGKISPAVDARTLAEVLAVIGDGIQWRRALDPQFDAKAMLPVLTALFGTLLNPAVSETAGDLSMQPFLALAEGLNS